MHGNITPVHQPGSRLIVYADDVTHERYFKPTSDDLVVWQQVEKTSGAPWPVPRQQHTAIGFVRDGHQLMFVHGGTTFKPTRARASSAAAAPDGDNNISNSSSTSNNGEDSSGGDGGGAAGCGRTQEERPLDASEEPSFWIYNSSTSSWINYTCTETKVRRTEYTCI